MLSPYLQNGVKVYRCPGDKIPSSNGQRVRSFSMNGQMGHYPSPPPASYSAPNYNPGYRAFSKRSDLVAQFPPVQAFIFLDEHPSSINDGYYEMSMDTLVWPDMPASRHGFACGFSFADGHAELHKWKNSTTFKAEVPGPPLQNQPAGVGARGAFGSQDFFWVADRSTIK
jgi:prepilin-type processing-associated H-X9-DG protein